MTACLPALSGHPGCVETRETTVQAVRRRTQYCCEGGGPSLSRLSVMVRTIRRGLWERGCEYCDLTPHNSFIPDFLKTFQNTDCIVCACQPVTRQLSDSVVYRWRPGTDGMLLFAVYIF